MQDFADRIFFVMGVPKSGTTWLQLLLDAHPKISCRGEDQFDFFLARVPRLLTEYNQLLMAVDGQTARQGSTLFEDEDVNELFRAIVTRALAKAFSDPRITRVGTKDNSIVKHLPVYANFFPAARFIFIVRDPRDLVVSSWFHNLRTVEGFGERTGGLETWTHTVANHWLTDVSKVLSLADRLAGRLKVLRYEDLHQDPQATLGGAFDFLEESASEAEVKACLEAASFETLTGGRSRGKEDRGSFFRKGQPGDWKNHLDDAAESVFRTTAGPLMAQFDYC